MVNQALPVTTTSSLQLSRAREGSTDVCTALKFRSQPGRSSAELRSDNRPEPRQRFRWQSQLSNDPGPQHRFQNKNAAFCNLCSMKRLQRNAPKMPLPSDLKAARPPWIAKTLICIFLSKTHREKTLDEFDRQFSILVRRHGDRMARLIYLRDTLTVVYPAVLKFLAKLGILAAGLSELARHIGYFPTKERKLS